MSNYSKPHLTYAQQVELLIERGMTIGSRTAAEKLVAEIGYYRLSGYWYPFRRRSRGVPIDEFVDGTTLDQVLALYDMDRRLKLLVLDAIERFEIAMRVQVGYTLGKRHPHAHLDPKFLDGRFSRSESPSVQSLYEKWRARIAESQTRSTEDFVAHFKSRYNGQLPVWVATEIMDFGTLSYLFTGAKRDDRDDIAYNFGVVDGRGAGNGAALGNWMRVLNYLRNVCAHHSRLWNRNMTVQVASRYLGAINLLAHIRRDNPGSVDRPYASLCVLLFLVRQISSAGSWRTDLVNTLVPGLAKSNRDITEMGFPVEWRSLAIWTS